MVETTDGKCKFGQRENSGQQGRFSPVRRCFCCPDFFSHLLNTKIWVCSAEKLRYSAYHSECADHRLHERHCVSAH
jgi:hypothetical protein